MSRSVIETVLGGLVLIGALIFLGFSYTKGDLTRFKKSQAQTETSTDESVLVEKRGRGRPRKVVETSDVAVVAVEKRGRGRPKKVHTEQVIPMVEVSAISQ
jgi:hypothetical protein